MGIKQTDIRSFLEPESKGFLYDTARSFLKRHSNPESLLIQLQNLLTMGQLDACRDMIQLVIREGHELGDKSQIYLLSAHVAYEQGENHGEIMAWVQQAKLCKDSNPETDVWDRLIEARSAIREGDIDKGQEKLANLVETSPVAYIAQYELAHFMFWQNINTEKAIELLEDVVASRPGFVKAWSCLGYAYNKAGNKEKAQFAFGQCIELDPNPERVKIYKQQLAS